MNLHEDKAAFWQALEEAISVMRKIMDDGCFAQQNK
jgi:hypothetical protein